MNHPQTNGDPPVKFRPSWIQFFVLWLFSIVLAVIGIFMAMAAGVCETDGCGSNGPEGWSLTGLALGVAVMNWWIVGAIVRSDQLEDFTDDDWPAMRIIGAGTLLALPILVPTGIYFREEPDLALRAVIVAIWAAIALFIGGRLALMMRSGTLRRSAAPFAVLALPIVLMLWEVWTVIV